MLEELIDVSLQFGLEAFKASIDGSKDAIRASLGLNRQTLRSLKNKKVLDIGCGPKAFLVEYLRKDFEIDAEGIDPNVIHLDRLGRREYLKKQWVEQGSPIPKPNNYYHLVLCMSLTPLLDKFSKMGYLQKQLNIAEFGEDGEKIHTASSMVGEFILKEGLRVLVPDGQLVSYPSLDLLKNRHLPPGYTFEEKEVHDNLLLRTLSSPDVLSEFREQGYRGNGLPHAFKYRTVINKVS